VASGFVSCHGKAQGNPCDGKPFSIDLENIWTIPYINAITNLGTKGSESKHRIIRYNQTHKLLGPSITAKHSMLTKRSKPMHELWKNNAATTATEILIWTLTSLPDTVIFLSLQQTTKVKLENHNNAPQ
jgi:hypothetical protein